LCYFCEPENGCDCVQKFERRKFCPHKDSENTKRSTKQHRLIFESYLKEKNIRNPITAVDLATVLRKFYAEAR